MRSGALAVPPSTGRSVTNRRSVVTGDWTAQLALLSIVALAACDGPLPSETQQPSLPVLAAAIVSNPVAASTSASVGPSGLALSGSAASELVYVSLPPWTIFYANEAILRNLRTGSEVSVHLRAGGFDPVAVPGAAGDTLELEVRLTSTDAPLLYAMVVPPEHPPVIVRTDPPPKKRDVPLNAAMVIVFSEPVDPATVTLQTVQLLAGGGPVGGSVTVDRDGLRAEFQPTEPLTARAEYQLVVTTGVTDLTGDSLTQGVTVDFTADGCVGMPNSVAVVTVSVAADCSVPDVVPSVQEAVRRVEPGGVIQFVSGGGTFSIDSDVGVTKPVTFRSADAGSPVIEVRRGYSGFVVDGVQEGTVTFSGLTFVTESDSGSSFTYSAVYAQGTYDQVVVEGSTFLVGGLVGVFGGTSSVPGARVTVRNNTFSFPTPPPDSIPLDSLLGNASPTVSGYMAVFGSGAGATLDVIGNLVEGPTAWGAVQFQTGASGRIENNIATQCGRVGCLRAIGGPGAVVVGNTVSSAPGLRTQRGITVTSAGAVVTGNVVNGGFAEGDPAEPTNYGYSAGGIQIGGGINSNATVTGNTVSGAVLGLEGNATVQTVQDNVITRVITAFSGAFGSAPLTKNDVTDYVIPFTLTFGSGGLACNWWGSASGPVAIPAGASADIYTPWATSPIARGAGGACGGN